MAAESFNRCGCDTASRLRKLLGLHIQQWEAHPPSSARRPASELIQSFPAKIPLPTSRKTKAVAEEWNVRPALRLACQLSLRDDPFMSVTELTNIGVQAGQSPKRYAPQWLERIDSLLEVHRGHFLFREPTAAELEMHKAALELAIQTGLLINSLIDDPGVTLRLQLLKDAYTIFHDSTFSEAETERRLKEVFPE